LANINDVYKKLDNVQDKEYYKKEARMCEENMQHMEGNILDEEAKVRKFL